jgi:selenocysteine lyase/cysteine desulfurase
MVSLGLDLRHGDEIILFGDNHPCNKAAWESRRQRYGFTIVEIPIVNPHPGPAHYLKMVRAALTPRTRLISFTHLTNTVGDLFPAAELCALAREHGVLSLMDGAQSFGLLDVDLGKIQPDFYSGSAHKWLCGPKEVGVLFVNVRAQSALWPAVISSGGGAVGISKTHEALGQRDEPAIVACGEALKFQQQIGRAAIEARSRFLAQRLMTGLRMLDGIKLYTDSNPAHSVAVVVFQPGRLDPAKLAAALYQNERIGCTARSGERPGLRISPHFYNLPEEIDRTLAAIKRYLENGLPA